MSTPRDPGNGLAHLSPELIERYERALRHPHAGVVKFMENAYATAASGDNAGLPEADRIRVYLSVYNTIQELTKGSADAAQADTDRLWGKLSAQAKRDMAANPGAAAAIVSDAIRSDPVMAAKLRNDTTALAPSVAPVFFDGSGCDPFDRMIGGNRIAGLYGGSCTANYTSLNGSTNAYNLAKGITTLTTQNFGTSPFVGAGFSSGDIPFIKQLHSEGYSTANIVNAGRDARVLGFSVKDHKLVKDLATVDRYDPDARGFVRKVLDLKHRLQNDDEYKRLAAELAAAMTPEEIKVASDAIARHEAKVTEAAGVSPHIRGMKNKKAREAGEGVTHEVIQDERRKALAKVGEARLDPALIDAAARGDAEATKEIGRARGIKAHDPDAANAAAALVHDIERNRQLNERVADKNTVVADKNTVVADKNDIKKVVVERVDVKTAASDVKTAVASTQEDDVLAGVMSDADPVISASKPAEPQVASVETPLKTQDKPKLRPRTPGLPAIT